MSADDTARYEALASLIERELELVGLRRFEELPALKLVRDALERTLPAPPPLAAAPALERCRLLQARVEIELLRVREALLMELAQVRLAQRTADGYVPAGARSPHFHLSA